MPRPKDPEKLPLLARTATQVFIENGYRRTQVADVARAMGVAKGTVYLYVESKEALFDLAARSTDPGWRAPDHLPVPTPAAGSTLAYLVGRLAEESQFPVLAEAAGRDRPSDAHADVQAEVSSILGELYDTLARNRDIIKLVDRCAPELPELSAAFYGVARTGLPALIRTYVTARQKSGALRAHVDVDVAARTVLETISFWAIHHHWDPAPSPVDDRNVREAILHFVAGALLP